MKGKLTALAVITALAVPAAADSATRELNGKIDGGGRIAINVKTAKGDPNRVSVGKIRIKRIVVRCEGTDNRLTFGIRGGAPINDERRFRISATDSQGGGRGSRAASTAGSPASAGGSACSAASRPRAAER